MLFHFLLFIFGVWRLEDGWHREDRRGTERNISSRSVIKMSATSDFRMNLVLQKKNFFFNWGLEFRRSTPVPNVPSPAPVLSANSAFKGGRLGSWWLFFDAKLDC